MTSGRSDGRGRCCRACAGGAEGAPRAGAAREAVEWARDQIVSRWDGLARLLRYNAMVLGMGRAPREGVVHVLHELADLEELFLKRLASATE
jgi:hypothetical protein